jgi:predicted metal-dependent hydrolase
MLRSLFDTAGKKALPAFSGPWPDSLHHGEETIPLLWAPSRRCKRVTIRYQIKERCFRIAYPPRCSWSRMAAFLQDKSAWIIAVWTKHPHTQDIKAGMRLPIRGVEMSLCQLAKGLPWPGDKLTPHASLDEESRTLYLRPPAHTAEWGPFVHKALQALARRELKLASDKAAEAMDTRYGRLSVRDTISRWGSCSAENNLSYCWRLIMAPPFVLTSVACHEVAHCLYHHHGPDFWALVKAHDPDWQRSKIWLKNHGAGLHRFIF